MVFGWVLGVVGGVGGIFVIGLVSGMLVGGWLEEGGRWRREYLRSVGSLRVVGGGGCGGVGCCVG